MQRCADETKVSPLTTLSCAAHRASAGSSDTYNPGKLLRHYAEYNWCSKDERSIGLYLWLIGTVNTEPETVINRAWVQSPDPAE